MANDITCPKCGHQFELNESLKNEVEKELRSKMQDWQKKKEEEFEKQKAVSVTEALQKAAEGTAAKLKSLEEEAKLKSQQLQALQKKELDLLRDKNALEEKQKNMEVEIEKRFLENKNEIEKKVLQQANSFEIVLVDVAESPIERPKKNSGSTTQGKRKSIR